MQSPENVVDRRSAGKTMLRQRVTTLEEEISQAEDEIARLETALQSFVSAEDTQRQSQELQQQKENHAALLQEWEELSGTLQQAE